MPHREQSSGEEEGRAHHRAGDSRAGGPDPLEPRLEPSPVEELLRQRGDEELVDHVPPAVAGGNPRMERDAGRRSRPGLAGEVGDPGRVTEEEEGSDHQEEPQGERDVGAPAREGDPVVPRVLVRSAHRRKREIQEGDDRGDLRPGRWGEQRDGDDGREGRRPQPERLPEDLATAHGGRPSWARTDASAATRDEELRRVVTTPTRRAWPSSTGLPGGRRRDTSNVPLPVRVTRPRRGDFPPSPMPITHSPLASGSNRAAGAGNGPSPSIARSTRPSEGNRSSTRAGRRAPSTSTRAAVPWTSVPGVSTWPSAPTRTPGA